ncbi:hypothetical protein GY45DRAFT_1331456 [Cubamyces sp. BRFM 1775]|nr:hypothetical protein GY45DRAFT_1331456 [Cubamyces sp. BRFM 1775]
MGYALQCARPLLLPVPPLLGVFFRLLSFALVMTLPCALPTFPQSFASSFSPGSRALIGRLFKMVVHWLQT